MSNQVRAHVVVPEKLLRDVDAIVGPRRRSEFFVEAAREKVRREKLRRLARELAGSLENVETPGWETAESRASWVSALRREGDERVPKAADE